MQEIVNALRSVEKEVGENIFIERAVMAEFIEQLYPASSQDADLMESRNDIFDRKR